MTTQTPPLENNLEVGSPAPEEIYQARVEHFTAQRDTVAGRMDRVANLRLLLFVLASAAIGWGLWQQSALLALLGIAILGGFGALVRHHGKLFSRRERYDELARLNQEALARIARSWEALPIVEESPEQEHPYAADLDILGRASVFQLLWPGGTDLGRRTLRSWLLAPAAPATVSDRQESVWELAPLLDLRQEVALRGRLLGQPDPEPFLRWAEGEPWLAHRRALLWLARGSILLLWALLIADATGAIGPPLWVILFLFNLALSSSAGRQVYTIGSRVESRQGALRAYTELFELLSSAHFQATGLRRLQDTLGSQSEPAHVRLRQLARVATLLIPQSSLLYVPIQGFTLWDFHVLERLERWQTRSGRDARAWLLAVGEAEALGALAGLAADNPSWTMPNLAPETPALQALELGHPLLVGGVRVHNDVEVGPPGSFLLVTGSNMSGKSTLLRAVGVNLVLAHAGGPVCAVRFQSPPVRLWTSMRVQDSLAQGESYFMAELLRLKHVVDAARTSDEVNGDGPTWRLFYLLDEILQGTNTRERQVAARRIISYLVESGALGIVSTHDLALADAEPLASMARMIHFTEMVYSTEQAPRMSFDYKARPGIATSTNALRLMEIVGLDLAPPARRA
ncbi:MAG: MutS family DNA mismatch repair protein [Chloroflexota bacterium]|nr:MutS family DNA mismatch repair protein [Chloroflexota bacterium]